MATASQWPLQANPTPKSILFDKALLSEKDPSTIPLPMPFYTLFLIILNPTNEGCSQFNSYTPSFHFHNMLQMGGTATHDRKQPDHITVSKMQVPQKRGDTKQD